MNTFFKTTLSFFCILIFCFSLTAKESNPLEGRWDIVISKDGSELPSWLEIYKSGHQTLVGRFVYAFGSARPIAHVKATGTKFEFSIPVQWEAQEGHMTFKGELKEGQLMGTMRYVDGKDYNWVASRAPVLDSEKELIWGAPMALFNGKDLSGWHTPGDNQWLVEDGILRNKASGSNLISDQKFMDFKLHIEFRYTKGSNSGVYLRGRYEVQIEDNKGLAPSSTRLGGIYGFLVPNKMVAKDPGEWQAYDITLVGRKVTVVANGVTIISEQIIPGITGGALDSKEGEAGSFMLQGDHGPIEYRNIVVTPLMVD